MKYMIINVDRCWGCRACQVACKREHELPGDCEKPMEVIRVEGVDDAGRVQADFFPVACQHCKNPACMAACPAGAISRGEDGAVLIHAQRCVGCGMCRKVCPYSAVAIYTPEGEKGKKAAKCDFCQERRSRGLPPSCVQHCLGQALELCDAEDVPNRIQGYYHARSGQVIYISQKLSRLGADLAHEQANEREQASKI